MGFLSNLFGGSSEPTKQEQAYDQYLDLRIEMIETSDNEEQWNALAQQAKELRSLASHDDRPWWKPW